MAQDPSSPDRNPFEVLGLPATDDLAAIRKAFLPSPRSPTRTGSG